MPFSRYVEIGRVALINYGEEYGKLVVISDVVDQNRALVDRPDEVRRIINFKRLVLTDFKIDIPRLAKKKVLTAALEESEVFSKFENSTWGKKLAKRSLKATQTDFERYQAAVARRKKSAAVKKVFNKLKSASE
ncbi:60S ribosomal protein L14 [Coccomyxa sp. Obi]|nr:60S ribosomal protein L14 [Coccomyxa sp. Obi]